jgi:hypothetical protein
MALNKTKTKQTAPCQGRQGLVESPLLRGSMRKAQFLLCLRAQARNSRGTQDARNGKFVCLCVFLRLQVLCVSLFHPWSPELELL